MATSSGTTTTAAKATGALPGPAPASTDTSTPAQTVSIFNPFNPSDWFNAFANGILQLFGVPDFADLMERLALIVFGGILIIVGIILLFAPVAKAGGRVALDVAAPESALGRGIAREVRPS
jgi:hypothetical protein